MFTSIDKAIVAGLSGLAFIIGTFFEIDFLLGIDASTWASIGTAVTAVLTWWVPNKVA